MRNNPVWHESIAEYPPEPHAPAVYIYLLHILAPVEFLS
jgi:hypothetical protein